VVTPAILFGIAAALALMALIPYDLNDPAWETGLNGVRLVIAIAVGFLVHFPLLQSAKLAPHKPFG
jgi:hypothetical protein